MQKTNQDLKQLLHHLNLPRPAGAVAAPVIHVVPRGPPPRRKIGRGGGLLAEILWRIGIHCLNRLDGRGIENLYVIGLDELLAKDAAFFHDNFAGSLTKRVLSFASRFEDFTDNLVFNIVGSLVPLVFASVVLWRLGQAAGRPGAAGHGDRHGE